MNDAHELPPTTHAQRSHKQLPIADERQAQRGIAGKHHISITSEYDALSADDMLHGYMMLRSARHFKGVSERYAHALAHKLERNGKVSAIKADELAYSTQVGWGDEWVPDLWSAQIWHKARTDNVILPLFRALEMPSEPFEIPTEGVDPTVHYVNETRHESELTLGAGNPVADSKIGSGKVTLSAKKLALRVGFSSELIEDSVVPILNLYREQAQRALSNAIDHVLLNGDTATTATGNINSDHTTPTSGSAYLALNGLRKLPIVTNSALAVNMGNLAPTLAQLRQARFKLPTRYATRTQDLAWIVDGGTYASLLALNEFLTMDKAGPLATAQTGQIGFIDGIPVYVSTEMPQTEADGKIGGTLNDRGGMMLVYRPSWYVGYRRRIAVSVDYIPYTDSYQLTATVRIAFANQDSQCASLLYNIAI